MEAVQRRNCKRIEGTTSLCYANIDMLLKLDATVTSLNRMGFFAEVGPLSVFVSNNVRSLMSLALMSVHVGTETI